MHAVLLSLLLGGMPEDSAEDESLPAASASVVVVCPAEFQPGMRPWLQRRRQQGYDVVFVSNEGSAEDIQARIRTTARSLGWLGSTEGSPRQSKVEDPAALDPDDPQTPANAKKLAAVLLVGDAPPKDAPQEPAKPRRTPTFHLSAQVNRHWGGDAELASDNPYADLDGDRVPDVAVGRLPADSPEELAVMLQKILDYEENRNFGPWRSRINLVAGEGGFGAVADATLETTARKLLTWGVPAAYRTTMTYAAWQSPYCPDPLRIHERCLERLNEGCLFWVYIGHGSSRSVKAAVFPDGRRPILNCDDCQKLNCGNMPPIALFLACHTGSFAGQVDCLAEELLKSPGGPVAVMSGSNVTMPYAMSALGREAMRQCFEHRSPTVGDLLLHSKRGILAGDSSPFWALGSALTASVAPAGIRPKEERHEHIQLFNLFGDPTMKLHHPRAVKIVAPASAAAGQRVRMHGTCPIDGSAQVELLMRRDRLQSPLPSRTNYNVSAAARAEFDATYHAANDPLLAAVDVKVRNGRFEAELPVPADAAGSCHVRVLVSAADDWALGAADISIAASQ